MTNNLVKQHITSYVLDVIPIKSTNHDELKKLCLTASKISDIECLFKMKESDYRSLITLSFETDKFINEITDVLVFNHPIFTQDVLPSIEKIPLLPFHLIVIKAS